MDGDTWTFTVTAADGTPMPEYNPVVLTPVAGETEAVIDFGSIKYNLMDVGKTYTYTITETGTIAGVTNDSVKTVTVTVSDNDDGTLKIDNSCETTPVEFVNTYEATGSYIPVAVKVMEGRDLTAEEFSFELKDADGKVLDTAKNAADGTITFKEITYTLDDVANSPITYTISEAAGNDKSVAYDAHEETTAVTLTDNGDGTITAEADKQPKELVFTNKTFKVKVQKVDVATGEELDGAVIQVLDQDGIVFCIEDS